MPIYLLTPLDQSFDPIQVDADDASLARRRASVLMGAAADQSTGDNIRHPLWLDLGLVTAKSRTSP